MTAGSGNGGEQGVTAVITGTRMLTVAMAFLSVPALMWLNSLTNDVKRSTERIDTLMTRIEVIQSQMDGRLNLLSQQIQHLSNKGKMASPIRPDPPQQSLSSAGANPVSFDEAKKKPDPKKRKKGVPEPALPPKQTPTTIVSKKA